MLVDLKSNSDQSPDQSVTIDKVSWLNNSECKLLTSRDPILHTTTLGMEDIIITNLKQSSKMKKP
jgi:hypothetical protein